MEYRDEKYERGIDLTLAVVGGKGKTTFLLHLALKTMRFSDLQRQIPDITRKMLTRQLRGPEAE